MASPDPAAEKLAMSAEASARRRRRPRFTSNVIGGIAASFDALSLLVGSVASVLLYSLVSQNSPDPRLHGGAALVVAVNFYLLRLTHDAYNSPMGRRQDADIGVAIDFLLALILVMVTIWTLGLIDQFSRGLCLFFLVFTSVLLISSRFVMRQIVYRLMTAGLIGQRVVIYGADADVAERAVRRLMLERLPHLAIVGIADERTTRVGSGHVDGVPMIGGFDAIIDLARRGEIDQVLIAMPRLSQQRLDHFLERLGNVAVDICLIPRETLRLESDFRVQYVGSVAMFYLWRRPLKDWQGVAKAIEDYAVAVSGLLLLAPVLVATAVLIKLTSHGPIFFLQKRFGFNNEVIHVFKFRSMYTDRQDVTGAKRTTRGDPRVTPIGRIIRRTSIDELPQLINVLKGEMSIVGPRPHAVEMKVGDDFYFNAVRGYSSRHRVKPGITGLAQVRGLRGEIDSIERARSRVEYDLYYINNWSVTLDFRIMAETLVRLIKDQHAY